VPHRNPRTSNQRPNGDSQYLSACTRREVGGKAVTAGRREREGLTAKTPKRQKRGKTGFARRGDLRRNKFQAGIPFERQSLVRVQYKKHEIGEARLDLLVRRQLVVELKTVEGIAPVHLAQVLSYLKIKRLRLGLLINFNVANLSQGIKRVIHSP